jgi:hypothetical protein
MNAEVRDLEVVSAILCDDVRDEIGNKKSLMGVLGGDIIVGTMPAAIQLALYIDFKRADKDKTSKVVLTFFVADEAIVKFELEIQPTPNQHASVIIPKGIVQFEKDGDFVVKLTLEDKTELEILRKTVSTQKAVTS